MRRLGVIDGLRGYFLVFMFLTHLYFAGGYRLVRFNHAELGFVQDAQGFIFLSGLLVGLVYASRMAKKGFLAGAVPMWRRSAELYAYTIGCVLLVLLLREVLPDAPRIWNTWLGGLGSGGSAFRLAGALLLYQPTYLDILPQYVIYLAVAPFLLWLAITGRAVWVAVGSLLLWLAVQTGVHLPAADGVNALLARADPDLAMRVAFNVLAWQVIFFVAMAIGALVARDRLDVDRIFDPGKTTLVKACAFSLLFFMAFRLGFTFGLVPEVVGERFRLFENRAEFSVIFFVNFAILGYVVAWMLIAGPRADGAFVRKVAGAMHFVFGLRFLRLLGRHSLQIYAWHVVLVYLVCWMDGEIGPFNEATKWAIAFVGIGLLALPAFYREWRVAQRARAIATGA